MKMATRSLIITILASILSTRGLQSYTPKQCDIRFWHVGVMEQLFLQETEMTQQQVAMLDKVEKMMERAQTGGSPLVPCTLLSTYGSIILPDSAQVLLDETIEKTEETLMEQETSGNSGGNGKISLKENRQANIVEIEDNLKNEIEGKENLRQVVETDSVVGESYHHVRINERSSSGDKGEREIDEEHISKTNDSNNQEARHSTVYSDSEGNSKTGHENNDLTELELDDKSNIDIQEKKTFDSAEKEDEEKSPEAEAVQGHNNDISQNEGVVIFYVDDDEEEENNKENEVPVLHINTIEQDMTDTINNSPDIDEGESENIDNPVDESDYRREESKNDNLELEIEGQRPTFFSDDLESFNDKKDENNQGESYTSDRISFNKYNDKNEGRAYERNLNSDADVKMADDIGLLTDIQDSEDELFGDNKEDNIATSRKETIHSGDIPDYIVSGDKNILLSVGDGINADQVFDANKIEDMKENQRLHLKTGIFFEDFQSISHNSTIQICPSPFSDKCYPFSENYNGHEVTDKKETFAPKKKVMKSGSNLLNKCNMRHCIKNTCLNSSTHYDRKCVYIYIQLFRCGIHDINLQISKKSELFESTYNASESTINTGRQNADVMTDAFDETITFDNVNEVKSFTQEDTVLHEESESSRTFPSDDTNIDNEDNERNTHDSDITHESPKEEAFYKEHNNDEINLVKHKNNNKRQPQRQEQQNINEEEQNNERIDMDKLELLLGKRESEQAARIQNLELMIVKLENKILAQSIEKQGDANVFVNLENQILKLENELLKLNQSYQKLQDDHEDLRSRQKKYSSYLELDDLSSSPLKRKYPAIADNSSKELMTQQQAKISELSHLIQNQTNSIHKLQSRSDYLEEQNQKLFQVVMNQTALISHIMNKLQELGEENLKGKIQAEQFKSNLEKLRQIQTIQQQNVEPGKEANNLEQTKTVESYDYAIDSSLPEKPPATSKSFVEDVLAVLKHSPTAHTPSVEFKISTNDYTKIRLCVFHGLVISNSIPFGVLYWVPCRPLPNSYFLGREITFQPEHGKSSFNVNPPGDTMQAQETLYTDTHHIREPEIREEDVRFSADAESEELLILRPLSGYDQGNLENSKTEEDIRASNLNGRLLEELRVESGENEKYSYKEEDRSAHEETDSEKDLENQARDGSSLIAYDLREPTHADMGDSNQPGTPLVPQLPQNVNVRKQKSPCEGNENSKDCKNFVMMPMTAAVEQKSDENVSENMERDEKTDIKPKTSVVLETGADSATRRKKDVQTDEEAKGRKKAAEEAKTLHEALHRKILYEPLHEGRPKDCYELYKKGQRQSGMSKIFVSGLDVYVSVYCDMDNGGWTLLLKREDGQLDFFRTYEEYKDGFGAPRGEHYIGNEVVHYLTNQGHYSLRVELSDWNGNDKHAHYAHFWVDGEEEAFRLHISGYSGNAGDGLSKHAGMKFSTYDVDQDLLKEDQLGGSCAKRFHGAGWYYKCYASNLMGRYYNGGNIPQKLYDGVTWKPWLGTSYSLKTAILSVRPFGVED